MLTWEEFEKVDMRVGTILTAENFPEARNPSYKMTIDFGEIGIKKTSAQVTVHYTPSTLMGRFVMGWVNAAPRQIGPFLSEFLLLGFADAQGAIRLSTVDGEVPLGSKMC